MAEGVLGQAADHQAGERRREGSEPVDLDLAAASEDACQNIAIDVTVTAT